MSAARMRCRIHGYSCPPFSHPAGDDSTFEPDEPDTTDQEADEEADRMTGWDRA